MIMMIRLIIKLILTGQIISLIRLNKIVIVIISEVVCVERDRGAVGGLQPWIQTLGI